MNKLILSIRIHFLWIFFTIFFACSPEPEVEDGILDSVEIVDPSLLNPEKYLVSAQISNPTNEDLNKPVIIAVHGYSASTFEWSELRK